jgi:hypothetical protein
MELKLLSDCIYAPLHNGFFVALLSSYDASDVGEQLELKTTKTRNNAQVLCSGGI